MVREKKPVKRVKRENEKRRGGRFYKVPGKDDVEDKVFRAAKVAAEELDKEETMPVHPHLKLDCLLNLGAATPSGDLSPAMKMLLRGDHGRDVLVVSVAENAIGPAGRAAFIASMAGLGVDAVFLPYSPSTAAAPQLTMYSIE